MIVTRFAPSPTGFLHLGHALSACLAYDLARAKGGRFILRIEDIDPTRCHEDYVQALYDDLAWLGLTWETPVRRQSAHMDDYAAALDRLRTMGLLYPCFCTRQSIRAEAAAALSAPHGPEGLLYPGTCKHLSPDETHAKQQAGQPFAWRIDMEKAFAQTGPLCWEEENQGTVQARPLDFGDVVLARKECPTSYHLSVTTDDALQGVTDIVRGVDLFDATSVHCVLQKLLGLPTPRYHHHRLLCGADGKRLAKRDHAKTLRALRQEGTTPTAIRQLLAA